MSANKMMQYTTKSGKVRVRTMPNGNEKSDLYTVLKNAVNIYTPIVKGLLHPQLVAERPAGDLERVLAFRKQQKTRFNDDSDKTRGVMVKEDIGRGEWILEMTGEIYLESQVKDRSIMEGENSHYLYKDIRLGAGNEPICMAVWKQETVGRYIRRSCQPTCRLVHLYGTELHLMVEAQRPMKSGEEVTLPLEADCQGFKDQLKCLHHQANPEDCPLEKERLLRKASNENPTAYSTVVTLTDSDEEIEINVPRQSESVESAGPSSSHGSARPSPEAPVVLRDSEIQGTSENENRRENEENLYKPDSEDGAQAEIDEPVENDDVPVVDAPRDACSSSAVNDVVSSLSTRRSNNAYPETAPEPMDAPEAVAQIPVEAAAPEDVDDIPAVAIDPPTGRRIRFAGNGRAALDLTEPDQVAVPVNVAPTPQTRMQSQVAKKTAGATVARIQNSRSRDSAAAMSSRTDRAHHTRSNARSVADVPPTIHNDPVVAPPAGKKSKLQIMHKRAAHARRCHREQNEALATTNVDPAPAPPAAPTTPAVVDPSATRRRRASQALSPVVPVSTRRRAASPSVPLSTPAPPPTATPRRLAPGPSAPPAVLHQFLLQKQEKSLWPDRMRLHSSDNLCTPHEQLSNS